MFCFTPSRSIYPLSLKEFKVLWTVLTVFDAFWASSSLDTSGFAFKIARIVFSVRFKPSSEVTSVVTFAVSLVIGFRLIMNLNPFWSFSYEYLIPASLQRLAILLNPLPNFSMVLFRNRIFDMTGFLISDSRSFLIYCSVFCLLAFSPGL